MVEDQTTMTTSDNDGSPLTEARSWAEVELKEPALN